MIAPKVILRNPPDINSFAITFSKTSNRLIDPLTESKAKKLWKILKMEYISKGVNVFDGIYYRLENFDEVFSGSTELIFSTIKYSTLQAYKELSKEIELIPAQYTNFISTVALIKTADNNYIFGKRSKTVRNSTIDFIGGGLLKSEREVNSGSDILKNEIKEIKEEINIKPTNIVDVKFLGILHSSNMNILFTFLIKLDLTKKEAANIFVKRKDREMSELIFTSEKELAPFLKSQDSYRPLVLDLLS